MITDKQVRGELLGVLRHEAKEQGSVVYAAAADELERLWALVAKLYTTEDDVPIVPNMTIWQRNEICYPLHREYEIVKAVARCEPASSGAGKNPFCDCFSTQAAARAAEGE
jgi:hypothetical protein